MSISDSVRAHSSMNGAGPHPHASCFVDYATPHGLMAAFGRPGASLFPQSRGAPRPRRSLRRLPSAAASLLVRPLASARRTLRRPTPAGLAPLALGARDRDAQLLPLEKVLLAGTKGQETGEFWLEAVEDRYLPLECFHDAARGDDECRSRGHVPFMLGDQRPRRTS